jgi:hypothetical protein
LPKKKKPVETIKIEGLTPESVKEFEPKEDSNKDDALWETYFKGGPNLIKLPLKQDPNLENSQSIVELHQETSLDTPVSTGVSTGVSIPVDITKYQDKPKDHKSRGQYVSLDATHTATEAKIYSVIYRETFTKTNEPQHFGALRLMKLTGIGSDKTVRKAIKGLIAKKSIVMVDPCPNHPLGPIYLALHPKEISIERNNAEIKIHPQTKKIITPKRPTGVRTGVDSPVPTPVKDTPVTPVETTPVTPVKNTGVPNDIPYISKNIINRDDSIENIESSSESSSNKEDDPDNDVFSHRVYIISLYEKYADNQWRVGDDEFYESENLKDTLPEVIEAAIIASVLRSKTKINSFAYCEGAIHEFQENLPLGYLSYLRETWRERKGREREESD